MNRDSRSAAVRHSLPHPSQASNAAELACRTLSARLEASPFYFGSRCARRAGVGRALRLVPTPLCLNETTPRPCGRRPTSLDAAVFGALCLLHESSPEVLEGFSVLADFRKRVLETYFVPAPTEEPPANAFLLEAGHLHWPPAAARASLRARGQNLAPLAENEINPSAGLRAVDAGPSNTRHPGSGAASAGPSGGTGRDAQSSSSAQPGWARDGAKPARGMAARWVANARSAWASMDSSAWAWAAVAAVTLLAPGNLL